mgnify:CR=1 FL=1|tara:strand:- start:239 stop:532 length:294 start_codon:yes stop_codon:yes gene_type:complete
MVRYKLRDGKRIQYTAEEEKIRDAEEKAWADGQASRDLAELRNERTLLLAETDWMSLPDAPTMSDAWKKYRQDLRDITKTYKSMQDKGFAFPKKPTE